MKTSFMPFSRKLYIVCYIHMSEHPVSESSAAQLLGKKEKEKEQSLSTAWKNICMCGNL